MPPHPLHKRLDVPRRNNVPFNLRSDAVLRTRQFSRNHRQATRHRLKDRSRESFDEAKLRGGMEKALQKRPVSREAVDEAAERITHKIRSLGEREVQSRAIGEMVMEELRHLDEVAFVRFASVYRHFQDVDAFRVEIEKLRQHPRRRKSARDADKEQLPLLPADNKSSDDERK